MGKRAFLWIQNLLLEIQIIERAKSDPRFRDVKGTTGAQGTFLALFKGDHYKAEQLDELVTEKAGFSSSFSITSQPYSHKMDVDVC